MIQEKTVRSEIKQRREEGLDTGPWEIRLKEILQADEVSRQGQLSALLDELEALESPLVAREPSDLEQIKALRPDGERAVEKVFPHQELYDRILGGWLARCAGCQLGKPVEGHPRENVRLRAELCGNWPVLGYFRALVNPPDSVHWGDYWTPANPSLLDKMSGMARDDDMDYTIANLRVLQKYGMDFTPENVLEYWLENLPFARTYTAERTAYRNYINGLKPPETASYRNHGREWIGASIRADIFGLVYPGQMEKAADAAFRDACTSHTANGIYGEMFYAAMIAAAFVYEDIGPIIEAGLREIPSESRLAQVAREVVRREEKEGFEATLDWIYATLDHYQGCHMISNGAITILGLAAGKGDVDKTLGLTVTGGWDADCTTASAGCIVGVLNGASKIPAHWINPLEDRIDTILAEIGRTAISKLAEQTGKLAIHNLTRDRYSCDEPVKFLVEEW